MKTHALKIMFTAIIAISQPANILAEVVTTDDNTVIDYQPYLEYLIEKSGELSFLDIQKEEFLPLPGGKANFGFQKGGYWFHLKIPFTSTSKKDSYLVLDYPLLDKVDLYLKTADGIQTLKSGDMRLYVNRSLDHRLINLKIPFDTENNTDIFYRVETSSSLQAAGRIIPEQKYHAMIASEQSMLGIYYGAMLVLLVYNLFIYIFLREKVYLIYSSFVCFYLLFQMCLNGAAFALFFPEHPAIPNYLLIPSIFLVTILCINYLIVFLETESRVWFTKLFKLIMVALIICIVASIFIPYRIMIILAVAFAIIVPMLLYSMGILRMKDGYKPARYYLLAWSFLFIGMIIYGMKTINIIPNNTFTEYAIQAGSLLEAILLSLGLAYRFDLIRLQNQKYSAELEEYSEKLEEKVEQRTLELQHTFSTLQNTQKNLVESEKKAALTQLAAGLAHELNNPLNYIAAGVPSLKKEAREMEEVLLEILQSDGSKEAIKIKDYFIGKFSRYNSIVKDIEHGVRRTATIVNEVRGLTELDGRIFRRINVKELIRKELMNARLLLVEENKKKKIRVTIETAPSPEIESNPFILGRVIRNLFANALYYAYLAENPEIRVNLTTDENEKWILNILNNGPSIPESDENRIFDMFFTTRNIGKGKGTGLSLAASLSANINGNLSLADHGRESQWVQFSLTLPLMPHS